MAIQQIQKSSTFKPDMIGDLVEVTVYAHSTGALATVVGVLSAYSVSDGAVTFKIDSIADDQSVPTEGYTLSITHYEYILDLSSLEADE